MRFVLSSMRIIVLTGLFSISLSVSAAAYDWCPKLWIDYLRKEHKVHSGPKWVDRHNCITVENKRGLSGHIFQYFHNSCGVHVLLHYCNVKSNEDEKYHVGKVRCEKLNAPEDIMLILPKSVDYKAEVIKWWAVSCE